MIEYILVRKTFYKNLNEKEKTMTKRKILFLLLVILCVSVLFTACEKKSEEQNDEKEILSYLKADIEPTLLYDEVSKLEGELADYYVNPQKNLAYDEENNLVVMRTTDLDNFNNVIETYKVYDLISGEVIFEKTNQYLYDERDNQTWMDVFLAYPLIVVKEAKCDEDRYDSYGNNVEVEYYYSYYVAEKDGQLLCSNSKDSSNAVPNVQEVENLYACTIEGTEQKTYWLSSDLEVLRTEAAITTEDDMAYDFFAEYENYLYARNDSSVVVFDKDGIASATYTVSNASGNALTENNLSASVLNNGYVLIQEMIALDTDAKKYDVMMYGMKFDINTFTMDHRDGEIKEYEVDFIIDELESAYAGATKTGNEKFPFKLTEGNENQAYVAFIENATFSANNMKYVIMDNELNITYEVKTDVKNAEFEYSEAITEKLWMVYDPFEFSYIADLDGKVITPFNDSFTVVGNHILTYKGIYDMNLNLVYDFLANGGVTDIDTDGVNIFMEAYNVVTDAYEYYVFNTETAEFDLFTDGIKTDLVRVTDGAYCIYDIENESYTVYNTDNKAIFVTASEPKPITLGDAVIFTFMYNGEEVNYVIK